MYKEWCKRCQAETWTWHNDFMVSFCSKCKRQRPYEWTPQAFICRYCERGQDETYPGQTVCNSCRQMDMNDY